MDISMDTASLPREIPSSDVTVLEGHTSEVCVHLLWSYHHNPSITMPT